MILYPGGQGICWVEKAQLQAAELFEVLDPNHWIKWGPWT